MNIIMKRQQTEPFLDQSYEEYYGSYLPMLQHIEEDLLNQIEQLKQRKENGLNRNPIEHYKARIKSPSSMQGKLMRNQMPVDSRTALSQCHDAVGFRIVCTFLDNVYEVAQIIRDHHQVLLEKDYIKNPKPNGYRSYHMILGIPGSSFGLDFDLSVEIQLRTIAMDCWASLEHQLKYKKNIQNQELIVGELKRCADEIASTDLTMQTIRELIDSSGE